MIPNKEEFLLVNSTSATLFLDNWPTNGCQVIYFVISYRSNENLYWKLLGDKIFPINFISITDLHPATVYFLHVTAHTEAGSIRHEFLFATRTLNGGKVYFNYSCLSVSFFEIIGSQNSIVFKITEMVPLESQPDLPESILTSLHYLIPIGAVIAGIIAITTCVSILRRR